MSHILTFSLGFLIAAIMSSSGYADKIKEAYDEGYKNGSNQKNI